MLTRAMLAGGLLLQSQYALAQSIELGLPIACTPGKDCWVQNYFDHDTSKAARDYSCGLGTYDGHDGTDIRIQDTKDHADVTASAPGTVKAVRDGMPDRLVRSDQDRAAIGSRECGNGVIIDHADGWQTQYCHMRKDTIVVKPGDEVNRGARLGEVGYSGMAAFPHVHLTVRNNGKPVDPFKPHNGEACGPSGSLWNSQALDQLDYRRGDLIGAGFASGKLELSDLEEGRALSGSPGKDWPALVFFGWAINLEQGDRLSIRLNGPGGLTAENAQTLDRHKAQYFLFAGFKRPASGWPAGEYVAGFTVSNTGGVKLSETRRAMLD